MIKEVRSLWNLAVLFCHIIAVFFGGDYHRTCIRLGLFLRKGQPSGANDYTGFSIADNCAVLTHIRVGATTLPQCSKHG